MKQRLSYLFSNQVKIYPLVTFRVVFGLLMLISTVRFAANGWIESQYIEPTFFFKYFGFGWVQAPSDTLIYLLFILVGVSALGIAFGAFYRVSTVLFFLCFTYLELIDATNYLNHYYFVSLIAFLLIWLPANRFFSIDTLIFPKIRRLNVSAWTINIIKFQLGVVYIFAGIAKLNSDWMLEALPLKIWLPINSHLPLIGNLLTQEWIAYAFSWGGAFFDLFILFGLIHYRTRIWAYVVVVIFHISTWLLFPIGMFPFIMIGCTLIFFSANFHKRLFNFLSHTEQRRSIDEDKVTIKLKPITKALLFSYILFQLLFPFRYLLYSGDLFWTEQGYRFSWRVMLMEKAGLTTFKVVDGSSGITATINNADYLTPNQEKMMATQPDFILQFAHFLEDEYINQGFENPKVYADVYVTLNGSGSQSFIDPNVDLTTKKDNFAAKNWVMPFE